MSNPHRENGFTPISNELLQGLAIAKLTNKERMAALFLIRRTLGWEVSGKRLEWDEIPLKVWVTVLQIDKSRASRILSGLEKKGVILRRSLGVGKSYAYAVNTIVDNWNNCIDKQLLSLMTTLVKPKIATVALSKRATPTDTDLHSTKEKKKEIIKELERDICYIEDKVADKIWTQALVKLKEEILQANYKTYLEGTVGLRYQDGEFIIGVPEGYIVDYLRNNQQSLIERAIVESTRPDVKVSFVLLGDNNGKN